VGSTPDGLEATLTQPPSVLEVVVVPGQYASCNTTLVANIADD